MILNAVATIAVIVYAAWCWSLRNEPVYGVD